MAKVSLSQAAKDTGVSLPTLSRWRASGKISANKKPGGGYEIDTSEYDRITEMKKASPNMKREESLPVKENATPDESKFLKVEITLLQDRLKDKDQIIEDLREDRDDWKKQAQTLLLKDQRLMEKESEKEQSMPVPAVPSPHIFERILLIVAFTAIGLFLILTLLKQFKPGFLF